MENQANNIWDKFKIQMADISRNEHTQYEIPLLELPLQQTEIVQSLEIFNCKQVSLKREDGKLTGKGVIRDGNNFDHIVHDFLFEYFVNNVKKSIVLRPYTRGDKKYLDIIEVGRMRTFQFICTRDDCDIFGIDGGDE